LIGHLGPAENSPRVPEVDPEPSPPAPEPSPRSRTGRRRARAAAIAAAAVVVAGGVAVGGVAAAGGFRGTTPTAGRPAVTVSNQACAQQWSTTRDGRHVYQVTNNGTTPEEVEIYDAAHVKVYAELEMIAPSTTLPMVAILPPGRYTWYCEGDDGSELYSNPRQLTGPPVKGASPFIPVTYDELSGAVMTYRGFVSTRLSALAAATDQLRRTVDAGHRARAEKEWLAADLAWNRIGAAYDTFGPFDDEINGRADGLVGGVDSPHWTGLLRLEYALWHHQPEATVKRVAATLDGDVHGLVRAFPKQQTDPNDLGLRAHEILENTLQFELTGDTDEGSHTNLATAWANVQGTQMTMRAIAPLLELVDAPLLARCDTQLAGLGRMLVSYRHPDGTWTPLSELTTSRRQHVDGAVGAMVEELSSVPDRLDLLLTHDNTN